MKERAKRVQGTGYLLPSYYLDAAELRYLFAEQAGKSGAVRVVLMHC